MDSHYFVKYVLSVGTETNMDGIGKAFAHAANNIIHFNFKM